MPRLEAHETLETALQKGKAGSLDVMLRMLAPVGYRKTMQSTKKFMAANAKWLARCDTISPKGRKAQGAKLHNVDLDTWNKLSQGEQNTLLANAEAMAEADIEELVNRDHADPEQQHHEFLGELHAQSPGFDQAFGQHVGKGKFAEQVEKEVRGEFHRYFAANCPEVKCAYSVCMPEQVSDLMPKNEIPYRILMAVESLDFQLTWQKIRAAKHSGQLLGHSSLTIIPYGEATDVGKGMLTVFYAKRAAGRRADRSDGDRFGVFGAAGPVATVDMHHDASSFYHDPSNTYTEAHSVFTDMLKYSPPDLSRE